MRAAASELPTAIREVMKGNHFIYISPLVTRNALELLIASSKPGSKSSDPLTPRRREVLQLVMTSHTTHGGARYDINLSSKVFAFGLGDLENDEFQKLDLRLTLGGGLGWHAKKTERTSFDIFGGGSLDKEYFSTGLNRSSGEVLIGEELTHKLSGRTSFKERAVLLPNMTETGEFRFNFDASAVTLLKTWLGWTATFSDRYISNPLVGLKSNDVLLSTGLRVTFGR